MKQKIAGSPVEQTTRNMVLKGQFVHVLFLDKAANGFISQSITNYQEVNARL
jgi:hypothetical protein